MGAFLKRVPERVLVVLDEAYNEYLRPELRTDSVAWVRRHPNLLVSRTFSKAYGLAHPLHGLLDQLLFLPFEEDVGICFKAA